MEDYSGYMRAAISEAEKSRFNTWPNPAVGAVLIKDGQIVARGRHEAAGGPHAEISCLADARSKGIDPRGAAMAVTLEPCAHYGKTPPCADALLEAGITTLIYGAPDPNPMAGGGAAKLARAGVTVTGPVLRQECEDLIADFKIWLAGERPYVILKLASSLDGRIAARSGQSRWISGPEARKEVHGLRGKIGRAGGAVLIGGGTLRADNPELTARLPDSPAQPLACVFSSRLPQADSDCRLLKDRPEQTIFFTSPGASASTAAEALRRLGARVFPVSLSPKDGSPDFKSMLAEMRRNLNCPYVLCEGGGRLGLSLLEAGLVDEFHLYMAPMALGDNDARPLFAGRAPMSLDEALKMRFCGMDMSGKDARLILRPALPEA